MMPLIETLYQAALENWSIAMGLLNQDEHYEYQKCCRVCEKGQERLTRRLTGEDETLWKRYLASFEQVQDTECRLCFARGLSMGLSLTALAKGE